MAGRVMKEAVPEEEYERMVRGLPTIKKPALEMPEPEKPTVEGQLDMKSLSSDNVVAVTGVVRSPKRNKEGVMFIGFDVTVNTRKGVRSGWVPEGEYWPWRRSLSESVDTRGAEI